MIIVVTPGSVQLTYGSVNVQCIPTLLCEVVLQGTKETKLIL